MHRLTIHFEGRVQGVGFRATVHDLSRGFDVVGFVRNRTDGSVELVAEGAESDLSEFHQAILRRLERYIVSHQDRWDSIDGPSYRDFAVAPTL